MNAEQIAWAAQHDWFVRDNGNGTIVVRDEYTDKTGKVCFNAGTWDGTFAALRTWAGY
ncbi:hypothetical protein ACJKIH_03035 [Brucella pseudogrignonensis]|uniref:hypothetical protein n=1 Tax=Brucella pseudogrignonensis TaxID=419475 RepID=UPI0038B487F9